MDRACQDLLARYRDNFPHVAHKERWDFLKPLIIELYTGNYGAGGRKTATMNQVVDFMKKHYSFHATPTEYLNHLRAWGIKKRVQKDEKDTTASALGRRKRPGTSTTSVTIQRGGRTEPLEPNKLARYIKSELASRALEPMAPGLLSSFNLPYAALLAALPKNPDEPSPYGHLPTTPAYLNIQSPEALTPGRELSGPSPNMEQVSRYNRERYALLFLQGQERMKDLFINICQEDRRILVDYFHDFYMHGFSMAKRWSSKSPNMGQDQVLAVTPQILSTPSALTPSAFLELSPNSSASNPLRASQIPSAPTRLCRWSIHTKSVDYVPIRTSDCSEGDKYTEDDPEPSKSPFIATLQISMTSGDFTSTPKSDLPIAQEIVSRSLEANPNALELDAWKFAIMAENLELLDQLFEDNVGPPKDIESIHPFHLAASYLNGGETCCLVFTTLIMRLGSSFIFHHNMDDLGHTILDALLVSTIRSHTSLPPEDVSNGFQPPHRYPGEEKDICGRWDPESPNLRELFNQGRARIPSTWKHPFCHTAVQAVCHCIIAVFCRPNSPKIDTVSGLFLRRCTECGLKLQLGPLHAVVVTAFYLANQGMPGETLFGIVAMMTCLLILGADSSLKANISVEEILRVSKPGKCYHAPISCLELMDAVPESVKRAWTKDCQTGWACLRQLLIVHSARQDPAFNDFSSQDSMRTSPIIDDWDTNPPGSLTCHLETDYDAHFEWLRLPCSSPEIGLLWATIQTELLTYRKTSEESPWVSEKFCMEQLLNWLKNPSEKFMIPLVSDAMMKSHSYCGWFIGSSNFLLPTAEDVCTSHFMNMDVYGMATFLAQVEISEITEFDVLKEK